MKGDDDDEGTPAELLLGRELRDDGVEEIRRLFVGEGPSEEREETTGLETGGDADGVTRGKRGCGFSECDLGGACDDKRAEISYEVEEDTSTALVMPLAWGVT